MSVAASAWAWRQRVGSTGAKLVLMALADTANDDGVCWPGQKQIADKAEISERAVRDNIAKLVNAGFIRVEERRRSDGTKTSNLYVLAVYPAAVSAGGPPEAERHNHRKPASGHEPSVEPSVRASATSSPRTHDARARARCPEIDTSKPPEDFPAALAASLPQVVAVLSRIAAARGANEVTTLAIARAMASYPKRPHLRAAEDLEHWLVHGTGKRTKVRDVVGFYRNQLDRRWDDDAPGGGGPRPHRPTPPPPSSAQIVDAYRRRGSAA